MKCIHIPALLESNCLVSLHWWNVYYLPFWMLKCSNIYQGLKQATIAQQWPISFSSPSPSQGTRLYLSNISQMREKVILLALLHSWSLFIPYKGWNWWGCAHCCPDNRPGFIGCMPDSLSQQIFPGPWEKGIRDKEAVKEDWSNKNSAQEREEGERSGQEGQARGIKGSCKKGGGDAGLAWRALGMKECMMEGGEKQVEGLVEIRTTVNVNKRMWPLLNSTLMQHRGKDDTCLCIMAACLFWQSGVTAQDISYRTSSLLPIRTCHNDSFFLSG